MNRSARARHPDVFASNEDFGEQLYVALRQSPWWMISIAIHVVVFVAASLLYAREAPADTAPDVHISATSTPIVEEPDQLIDRMDPVHPTETEIPVPVVKNEEESEVPEMDVDLPYDDSFGEDGLSDAPFTGPADNGLIGLGGGAGGSFRGIGGKRDRGNRDGFADRGNQAVEDALRWLAAHQSPNGGWEAAGFDRWCDGKPVAEGPDGGGMALYDPGVTGLALCAFLGAGYTHRGNHPFTGVVSRGLRYLKTVQDAEGCFGPRTSQHFIYNHATAALAMVEAYGMTESAVLRRSAQSALDFISLSRNPYFAWRYGIKPGDNDTSVTGWMMMALKSARMINEGSRAPGGAALLTIDEEAFDGIRAWVDKMTDPDTGRVGYMQRGGVPARPQDLIDRFPSSKSESLTGVGVLARVFSGEDPRRSEAVKKGAQLMSAVPPVWNTEDGSIDMYYWYYATLAMYQVGGPQWKAWHGHLESAVIGPQRHDGTFCLYKGSWDPIGPWGAHGGRVYSTAVLAMCLEIYYRYPRVFVGIR